MNLPNGDQAEVDLRKLRDYCLSPTHPVEKHKARVFRAVFGLTQADSPILQTWLLQAALTEPATTGRSDEYGDRYQLDFAAATAVGRASIRSVWMIRAGEDHPRLTTCYVLSS